MSQKVENKKRSILENLNGHLQVQAIRLKNVDLETNIFPDYKIQLNNNKKMVPSIQSRNFLYKTYNNNIPIAKQPIILRKTTINNQKSRKIRPYDPLYTWNRGGRLKELRIRCQARKFFYLWRNKTIGNITFLKAEQHYRKKLLKKAWQIWYDQYWLLRVEPRHFGRAILFRKAIVIRKIFITWQAWVNCRKCLRIKMSMAIEFNDNHLKQVTLNQWVSWILVNRCKNKLNLVAELLSRKGILVKIFSIWRNAFGIKLETNSKMIKATNHHRIHLLRKIFHNWIEARPVIRYSQLNLLKARNNYNEILLKKTLDQWIQYHQKYKIKEKEKDKCDNHYHWNLAHRYLIIWRDHYRYNMIQAALYSRSDKLAKRFQLRKYLSIWKQYHLQQQLIICQRRRADEFRYRQIKKRAWLNITENVLQSKYKVKMKEAAIQFYNKFIIRKYLNKWVTRFEEKEDYDKRLQFGAARSHYRRSMFSKCIQRWSKYTSITVTDNKMNCLADSNHHKYLLKRILRCWMEYVIIRQNKKHVLLKQDNFIRNCFMRSYWQKWRDEFLHRQFINIRLMGYLDNQNRCKQIDIFLKWKRKTHFKLQETLNLSKAIAFNRQTILRKCFLAFFNFMHFQEQRKINCDLADMHFQNHIMSKVLYEWRSYCIKKEEHKRLLLHRFDKIKSNIMHVLFISWQNLVKENSKIRKIAEDRYENKIQKKMLEIVQAWQQYSKESIAKKNQTIIKLSENKNYLNKQIKRQIFTKWRKKTSLILEESSKMSRANEFFRHNCIKKYLGGWLQYCKDFKIKYHLNQQSSWFSQRCKQLNTWIIWRQVFINKQREQYYTKFALIHWSNKLQGKILFAWFKYSIDKQKSKSKETEALLLYKTRLIKYTIHQWIMSADFLYQWRNEQNIKRNYNSNVVEKAVQQWKRFTEARTKKCSQSRNICDLSIEFQARKISPRNVMPVIKIRPQPKVPNFLKELHHSERMLECSSSLITKNDISNCPNQDEVLLSPMFIGAQSSHCNSKITKNEQKTNNDLLKEITEIKERLQHFKELKSILSNLQADLFEYDKALSQLSPTCNDSSFYQEFSPLNYRDKLDNNIKDIQQQLDIERPNCIELSKRFQEIMKIFNTK